MTRRHTAFLGIALSLGLGLTRGAEAQTPAPDAGDDGVCTTNVRTECTDRCPSYDTCYIEADQQIYYRVKDQRIECDGLECKPASAKLDDYCCRRGEYAPSKGGGGGCALAGAAPASAAAAGPSAGLALAAVYLLRRARRARSQAGSATMMAGGGGRD